MACIVCKSPNATITDFHSQGLKKVKCPLCIVYLISRDAVDDSIIDNISEEDRKLFSGHLRNNTRPTDPIKLLSADIRKIPETVMQYKRLTALDKVHSVIRFLAENSPYIGAQVSFDLAPDYNRFYCKNEMELGQIRNYLDQTGIIKVSSGQSDPILTIHGWEKYESLKEINQYSKRAFVAMSFDEDLNDLFDQAIAPACDACGFKAHRTDMEEHNEDICDKIIAGIKSSRFVIADFTRQKHNVYYEAGYAKGMGLEVIWCCKEEDKDSLKFDIRQYNHILWSDYEDLKKRLIDRIHASL